MFEREYYALVELAHPRIVRVFDYGVDGETPYYTMEMLDGVDAHAISRAGALSVQKICLLLRACASALALIHDAWFIATWVRAISGARPMVAPS